MESRASGGWSWGRGTNPRKCQTASVGEWFLKMASWVIALENSLAPRCARQAKEFDRCSSALKWVSLLYLPIDIVCPCVLRAFESLITNWAFEPIANCIDGLFLPVGISRHVSGGSRLLPTHSSGNFAPRGGQPGHLPNLTQDVGFFHQALHPYFLAEWLRGRILSMRDFA